MQRPFKFTKLKLITGYILILLLGAIAIIFIYKQTIALTQKGSDEIVIQQKLFIISNTLTKLYEAENTGIAFSQTGTQKNFDTYLKLIEKIRDNMDTVPLSLIVITPLFIFRPPYFSFGQFLLFLCAASPVPRDSPSHRKIDYVP